MEEIENLHEIQRSILNKLLFKKEARFSQLKEVEIESDQFNFHLKRLLELELVEKNKNKKYELTVKGKEYAKRFDTQKAKLEKQAKVGVLIVVEREENENKEYLIQKRLKQPYYGYHGFITGKVGWGETLNEAAKRELKEESGLIGKLSIKGVKHKIDYSSDGDLLEDKFFFVFKAENPEGRFIKKFEGGENIWLPQEKIFKLDNLFFGVEETLDIVKKDQLEIREDKYKVEEY